MISMRMRRLYLRLSYLMGLARDLQPGIQGMTPFFPQGSPDQSASRHEEAERATIGLRYGMKLGAHAIFCTSN